jgi:ribosomal protein uS17
MKCSHGLFGQSSILKRTKFAVLAASYAHIQDILGSFTHSSNQMYSELRTDIFDKDKKCPFTGLVSIRGRILTGTVVSTKMHRTLIIRREYLHFVPKYDRYEKRHKNLAAHVSPAFRVEEGDQVTVGQCRPLSKTVCVFFPESFLQTDF